MHHPWPKAILLDLDDTILAFDAVADQSWVSVCTRFASEFAPVTVDELLEAIKSHAKWYWNDPERHRIGRLDLLAARQSIVGAALGTLGIPSAVGRAERIAEAYGIERDRAIEPIPGAIETVIALREAGVKLALLTNGAALPQRSKIERFGLASLFDCILIEGEFGVGKPSEGIYRQALKELGVEPYETWMIGDNFEWEVVAPQRLGIRGIWIDSKGTGIPESCEVRPYRTHRTLADIRGATFESVDT